MPVYTRVSQISLLICYQLLLVNAGATCYNPDQVVPKLPYYVCNTTSGEHSACCGPGDPCTTNGYCFGSAGYMYRGGCTDITWQSPNCCPACRDSAINSFSNIYACPINNGSRTHYWCCGAQEQSQDVTEAGCCQNTLFPGDFGIFANAQVVLNTTEPNLSTLATSSLHTATSPSFVTSPTSSILSESAVITASTITPTPALVAPSSGPTHPAQTSMAVGTGVGLSAGVLLLFILVFFFLRERRRRVHAQQMVDDASTAAKGREREMQKENKTTGDYGLHHQILPQELEYMQRGPEEIYSREVHEANGDF